MAGPGRPQQSVVNIEPMTERLAISVGQWGFCCGYWRSSGCCRGARGHRHPLVHMRYSGKAAPRDGRMRTALRKARDRIAVAPPWWRLVPMSPTDPLTHAVAARGLAALAALATSSCWCGGRRAWPYGWQCGRSDVPWGQSPHLAPKSASTAAWLHGRSAGPCRPPASSLLAEPAEPSDGARACRIQEKA
jgi:hypothetical protein